MGQNLTLIGAEKGKLRGFLFSVADWNIGSGQEENSNLHNSQALNSDRKGHGQIEPRGQGQTKSRANLIQVRKKKPWKKTHF